MVASNQDRDPLVDLLEERPDFVLNFPLYESPLALEANTQLDYLTDKQKKQLNILKQ